MLYWALVYLLLIVVLVAGLLGFTGIAGISANITWILFAIGLVLFVVLLLLGRRAL